MTTDVLVLGGGSAGMAAALKAREAGAKVIIIERENRLGGILNQCIHNGFGLQVFKKELTGPEYANEYSNFVKKSDIKVMLNTSVLKVAPNHVEVISPKGKQTIQAKAIVLAMGCRERPSASISLCGTRPAGIITAGCAQKLINIYGKMIGKKIVIVGSGDIGLIMARRLIYEGASVVGVYEIMPTPSGLQRNICQCLQDYNIPLYLGETVTEVVGKDRVEGVYVAKYNNGFDMSTKKFVECDTILLSVGLTPENALVNDIVKLDNVTGGPFVNEYYQTSCESIFACGNVLHVHDIVDNVTKESELAGKYAGMFALNQLQKGQEIKVTASKELRYILPNKVYMGNGIVTIKFRPSEKMIKPSISVICKGKEIFKRDYNVLLPAEMQSIIIDKSKIIDDIMLKVVKK